MSYSHSRTNEGGSLASFVVIGLVLAALVIGGIYTVQKKSEQPKTTPSASPSVSKKSPSASPASPQAKPSEKPKVSPPVPTPSRAPIAKTPSNNHLPATGPSEDFASIVMFAGLVGLVIAYIRSRTALRFAYQVD